MMKIITKNKAKKYIGTNIAINPGWFFIAKLNKFRLFCDVKIVYDV